MDSFKTSPECKHRGVRAASESASPCNTAKQSEGFLFQIWINCFPIKSSNVDKEATILENPNHLQVKDKQFLYGNDLIGF